MRLIARGATLEYATTNSAVATALGHGLTVIQEASWTTMSEAAKAFSTATSVSGDRIRYERLGGDYRLIVAFDFERQITFAKFIGTHAEYDKVDAQTVAQF